MDNSSARQRARSAIALLTATYEEASTEALDLLVGGLAEHYEAARELLRSLPEEAHAPTAALLGLVAEIEAAAEELRGLLSGMTGVAYLLAQEVAVLTGQLEREVLQRFALLLA